MSKIASLEIRLCVSMTAKEFSGGRRVSWLSAARGADAEEF